MAGDCKGNIVSNASQAQAVPVSSIVMDKDSISSWNHIDKQQTPAQQPKFRTDGNTVLMPWPAQLLLTVHDAVKSDDDGNSHMWEE